MAANEASNKGLPTGGIFSDENLWSRLAASAVQQGLESDDPDTKAWARQAAFDMAAIERVVNKGPSMKELIVGSMLGRTR